MNNNPMTKEEANQTVYAIHLELASADKHLSNVREFIVDLYQRRGWEALEYPSWRQCVLDRFTGAASTMYRQLHAGMIEQLIGVAIGDTPEAHLRGMTDLTPEATAAVWQVVKNTAVDGNVTAAHVRSVTELCRDVFNLGYIEINEGEQIPVNEATPAQLLLSVNQDQLETILRNRQHVRDAMERKHGASVKVLEITTGNFSYSGSRIQIEYEMDTETAWRLDHGKEYRIVFYEVAQEKELTE